MRERSSSLAIRAAPAARSAPHRAQISVDVVLLSPHGRQLTALLNRTSDPRARERWELPWDASRADEAFAAAATRVARSAIGIVPSWLEQVGAFGGEHRHPSEGTASVAFIGLAASGTPLPVGGEAGWFPVEELPPTSPRQRAMIDGALESVRVRLDQSPIAFRLLPPTFTLSQLQEIYEVLLSRRLHKASFRRALHAAWLVEPTDEWRSEGRGRPAQLFRYAPRKRRSGRRGVRFDLML